MFYVLLLPELYFYLREFYQEKRFTECYLGMKVDRWCVLSSGSHELMKLCRLAVSLQAVSLSCRLPTFAKNSAGVWAILLWGIGSCLSRGV